MSGTNATERELRFFQELTARIPDLIWCFDLDFNLTYINPAVTACLGYSREEVLGCRAEALLTPHSYRRALDIIQAEFVRKTRGESFSSYVIEDMEHIRKDGTTVWLEAEGAFIFGDDGRPTGFMGISRDVTKRRQALAALETKETHLQELVKESQILAKIGRIVSSSLEIEDIYEPFAQEVIRLIPCDRLSVTLTMSGKECLVSAYSWGMEVTGRGRGEPFPLKGTVGEKIIATGQSIYVPQTTPEFSRRFTGSLFFHHPEINAVLGVPLMAQSLIFGVLFFVFRKPNPLAPRELRVAEQVADQIAGALATARLWREQKRLRTEGEILEERLRQAQKMEAIGTLAGGIAHDFNNILSAIIGYTELASWELPEGSRAKKNLERVVEAAFRGRDLSRQILTFSRKTITQRQPLDLAPLVKEGIKLLRASIPSSIEIRSIIEGENHAILADGTEIHQIIMNLVTNAANAIETRSGIIEVTLTGAHLPPDQDWLFGKTEGLPAVRLRVADNGCGMTAAVLTRIFEPYFTTREEGKGTGLGLPVVLGIVNACGGAINVTSEPGKGSIFDLYFPALATQIDPLPGAPQDLARGDLLRGGGEFILLVDDEEAIVAVGREFLTNLGYRVVAFSNSREALAAFQADPYIWGLVITDLTMPGLSGYELAAVMKKDRPALPVILCTGYHETDNSNTPAKSAVDEVLLKPLSMEKLAAVVREVLARRPGEA